MFKNTSQIQPFATKIWLSTPTIHGEEQEYVESAFATNWVSTIGENLNQLEIGIQKYIGCKYSVALSAGTAALHLAVKLAGIKQGDVVLCSDMTFAATVNPVAYEKGKLVFIDSEYDTWNMDPIVLEKAFQIYPNVKAVIVANLYGVPAKLDEIQEICKKYNAILIEDAAESLGATYKGVQTGTFGMYNAISFNGNKIITTSGGGMLLTDDKDAAELARKWSTQSRENVPWYQHEYLGYNYRMSNIVAGIGRGQLFYLQKHIAKKKAIYMRYKEGLKGLPIEMNPYDIQNMEPNFWLSCFLIKKENMCKQERTTTGCSYVKETGKSCPDEIREVLADYNIESRPIWKPMHMQPVYEKYEFITAIENRSVDEDIFQRGLCLPSDIKMKKEEQDKVIEIIKNCFE